MGDSFFEVVTHAVLQYSDIKLSVVSSSGNRDQVAEVVDGFRGITSALDACDG